MAIALVVTVLGGAGVARGAPTDVFFSEYIEGSSNNKALEIYNGTGATVNLAAGGYNVQMFFNGIGERRADDRPHRHGLRPETCTSSPSPRPARRSSPRPTRRTAPAGSTATTPSCCEGRHDRSLDVIGQIGFDPGTEWGTGLDEHRRQHPPAEGHDRAPATRTAAMCSIRSVEWNGFAIDTFGGLGSHALGNAPVDATCGAQADHAAGYAGHASR